MGAYMWPDCAAHHVYPLFESLPDSPAVQRELAGHAALTIFRQKRYPGRRPAMNFQHRRMASEQQGLGIRWFPVRKTRVNRRQTALGPGDACCGACCGYDDRVLQCDASPGCLRCLSIVWFAGQGSDVTQPLAVCECVLATCRHLQTCRLAGV